MNWLSEYRIALRGLLRRPVYTVASVASLSFGLALAMATYAVTDAVVNPQLPYVSARDLWTIRIVAPGTRTQTGSRWDFSRARLPLVDGIAGWDGASTMHQMYVEVAGKVFRTSGARVSEHFLGVLGVAPVFGRLPEARGTGIEVAISERLWRRLQTGQQFSPFIITRGTDRLVVTGVLPLRASLPDNADYWQPIASTDAISRYLIRAKPGANSEGLNAQLQTEVSRIPGTIGAQQHRAILAPLSTTSARLGGIHRALLLGGIAVFLVACVNLSTSQLARGLARMRELTVRAAVGATPGELVRALVAESVVITAMAGLFGILGAYWISRLLTAYAPTTNTFLGTLDPQWSGLVAAFSLSLFIVAGVGIGLLPALRVVNTRNLLSTLHSGATPGRLGNRMSLLQTIIVGELAIALMLVFSANMMAQTAQRLLKLDIGYDGKNLISVPLRTKAPPLATRDSVPAQGATATPVGETEAQRVFQRLRGDSAVEVASLTHFMSLEGSMLATVTEGGERVDVPLPGAIVRAVDSRFMETLRVTIVSADAKKGEPLGVKVPSVIIDEQLAKQLWPRSSALGKRLKLGALTSKRPWLTVSAVLRPTLFSVGQCQQESCYSPAIFLLDPSASFYAGEGFDEFGQVFLRVRQQDRTISRLQHILATSPEVASYAIGPIADEMGLPSLQRAYRLVSAVFASLAGGGLLLAALGVFALVNGDVERRMKEYGVRVALGATPNDIRRLVMVRAARMATYGVVAGVLLSWWAAQLTRHLVMEFSARGISGMLVATLCLVATVMLSSLRPAFTAAGTDTVSMLRAD